MRVMVVVMMMVPRQHERIAYERADASSIAKIRWRESGFVIAARRGHSAEGGPLNAKI